MTLENTLHQKLTEWHPPEGRHSLTVPDPEVGWQVTVTADRKDVLGCLLWEVALQRLNPAADGDLRAWADRISRQLTGLLEPLKIVEIDAVRNEGLLRSNAPAQKGENLFYYEVLLKGTQQALVRRYQAGHQEVRREQIAFALTYEALGRLVESLTAA